MSEDSKPSLTSTCLGWVYLQRVRHVVRGCWRLAAAVDKPPSMAGSRCTSLFSTNSPAECGLDDAVAGKAEPILLQQEIQV